MTLSLIDQSIVSNLRHQFGDKLASHTDEHIAKAWREYSLSGEYQDRHEKPDLFIDWVEMARDDQL